MRAGQPACTYPTPPRSFFASVNTQPAGGWLKCYREGERTREVIAAIAGGYKVIRVSGQNERIVDYGHYR